MSKPYACVMRYGSWHDEVQVFLESLRDITDEEMMAGVRAVIAWHPHDYQQLLDRARLVSTVTADSAGIREEYRAAQEDARAIARSLNRSSNQVELWAPDTAGAIVLLDDAPMSDLKIFFEAFRFTSAKLPVHWPE